MTLRTALFGASLLTLTLSLNPVTSHAQEGVTLTGQGLHTHSASTADDHAPIGVMGDHIHKKGEWMVGLRAMHMNMDGNRKGTSDISANTIVTTEANRFFGMAGQPATLRIVPTEMTMDMQMVGAMYAPADWVTVMAMGQYVEKDMDSLVYSGGAGTTIRGTSSMESSGWGDTKLGGLFRLYEDDTHTLILNAGVSLPTGSIDEEDTMLMPNGMMMNMRLGYAMQLGTGTYDFLPGLTYNGHTGKWGWGAQYAGEIRMEDENSEGYSWGDKHRVTTWGSYEWADWISTSARVTGTTQGSIDGIDSQIMGPIQTADPDNYGGQSIDVGLGVNLMATDGFAKGHRLAIEATAPVYQNLHGPQMETDYTITAGWQYAF